MTPDEYSQANPLGGPASMFDTIAERIRAGEDITSVMDDYSISFNSSARPESSSEQEVQLGMLSDSVDRLIDLVMDLRSTLAEIYALRGEDEEIARLCRESIADVDRRV